LLADKRPVFFVEAAQAGIFRVANVPEDSMKPLLMIGCPNVLFPYLRELVSNGVSRAGFQQQVLLAPVDFEAMYLNNENVA
jgi:preprotein translocase subunit SecB